ncbi:histidine kinase [Sporosarcina cyprini]|uniref:histidine kinase n=1 Tax=Sporosarcina cyprini TaxID=2910523 RepID=UPI001EDD8BB0|nr:histidine kinase [Sporosarcina cyprini]MCG3087874.1 histidine kinase [Sporosarcina cyprini]
MRIFKYSVPIGLIVGWIAWYMLTKNFQEVPETSRVWITIGAAVFSGIIAYFLFPKSEDKHR